MSGLHIKYRPRKLEELWGNEEVKKALSTVLKRPDPPHAYLITGPSGCGKTTIGRIIKSSLGCSDRDYKEMDTADFRGIDHIRDIRKQMRLHPLDGGCRVWLLDECHQLSKDAQNALLKALEDTPRHVYFILATTDPDKLLKTIRNRCSHFQVSALDGRGISKGLRTVARKERKDVPPEVRTAIAKNCGGSPRSALVMLDKVIDLPTDEQARAVQSINDFEAEVIELCRMLVKKSSWKKVAKTLKGIQEEPETVRRAVLGYFSAVLLNSGDPRAFEVADCFRDNFYDSGKAGLVMACYEACQL